MRRIAIALALCSACSAGEISRVRDVNGFPLPTYAASMSHVELRCGDAHFVIANPPAPSALGGGGRGRTTQVEPWSELDPYELCATVLAYAVASR